jgi:hypothetical protein
MGTDRSKNLGKFLHAKKSPHTSRPTKLKPTASAPHMNPRGVRQRGSNAMKGKRGLM